MEYTISKNLQDTNPEKVKQTVAKMRQVCQQFDALNLALDELIAQIKADMRKSPLTAYRLGKKKTPALQTLPPSN